MRIAIVSREYGGIVEAGGVKNVTRSLCESLRNEGNEVFVFLPVYDCTDLESPYLKSSSAENISFEFIEDPVFLCKKGVYTYTKEEELSDPSHKAGCGHIDSVEEDILFQRLALKRILSLKNKDGIFFDAVHCQDAATSLVPVFALENELEDVKNYFSKVKFFVTIHNAGASYRHSIFGFENAVSKTGLPCDVIKKGFFPEENCFEPFALASFYSVLTTVSPAYAEFLECSESDCLTKFFKSSKVKIEGITNGIDFEEYNPENPEKSLLPFSFNPSDSDFSGKLNCRKNFFALYWNNLLSYSESDPVICFHGRLVCQKGVDLLFDCVPFLVTNKPNIRILVMGQGESELENRGHILSAQFPQNFWFFNGYEKALSRLMIAASDFMILPSRFEPCGLEDFIAQIFATIPIAHKTGGLQKIRNNETGFLYEPNESSEIERVILKKINEKESNPQSYLKMKKTAFDNVRFTYSWKKIVKKYIEIYKKF